MTIEVAAAVSWCPDCDGVMTRLGPTTRESQACGVGRCATPHPVDVVRYSCPHGAVAVKSCACRGCDGGWGRCGVAERHAAAVSS